MKLEGSNNLLRLRFAIQQPDSRLIAIENAYQNCSAKFGVASCILYFLAFCSRPDTQRNLFDKPEAAGSKFCPAHLG